MADALDMSLDDLITKNKPPQHRRGRRNPASGGPTPTGRRFHTRAAAAPYHQLTFQHQAPPAFGYVAQPMPMTMAMVAPPSGIDTGTKLYVSNLDYNVSNEDIKARASKQPPTSLCLWSPSPKVTLQCAVYFTQDLFSEVGDIKRYSINYDKSGRSKGTAEVVFSTRSDALAALKKYNNVHLDGKPMKIEVIGTNIEAPAPAIFAFTAPPGNFNFPSKSGSGRGGGRAWPRGAGGFGGHGRGRAARGRGRGRRSNLEVSAKDLDADLDKYHSEAMQTS